MTTNVEPNVDVSEEADPPKQRVHVDQHDASSLLDILISRGYFHAGTTPLRSIDVKFPDANEAEASSVKTFTLEESMLIVTNDNSFVMLDTLQRLVLDELQRRGRLTIQAASDATNVSADVLLQRVVPRILDSSDHEIITVQTNRGSIKEILTANFIEELTNSLWSQLLQTPESGMSVLTEVSQSMYKLPIDTVLSIVEKKIFSLDDPSAVQILLNTSGSKVLVTSRYLKKASDQIAKALRSCNDSPVDLKGFSKEMGCDITWVMRFVKDGSFAALPGEFHGDTYVPTSFTDGKRRSVMESFSTNGFVTSHMCHIRFGILPSQMKEFLASSNGDIDSRIVLDNTVVHMDSVVAPLIEAAKEAAESSTWLDLQHHIPVEMLEHQTDDARTLVKDYICMYGIAYVDSKGGLFFCQSMITSFCKNNLPSLIQTFASTIAAGILEKEDECAAIDSVGNADDVRLSGKEKHRSRHAYKSKHSDTTSPLSTVREGSVPLEDIVQLLFQVHPDLESADVPRHVLTETCRISFCTEAFDDLCDDAVRAELERLRQAKRTNQSFTLGTFHSVEAAFEDSGCFSTLCYMIQARAKFLSYALDHLDSDDESTKTLLERDFLASCCAEFTRRVTQYALLKNNVDDGIFTFQKQNSADGKRFFHPVDLATRSRDVVFLACNAEKVGQRQDPLELIREELPKTSGVALARQWVLCGGECYHGGVKTVAVTGTRDETITRPGDVSGFLSHVREHCLTICGIPFTNLDKKAEKKFLHARRAALVQQMDATKDSCAALELRIMWQYQLTKSMVVSGWLLRGPVLKLLLLERKVPESTAELLAQVAEKITANEDVDTVLVDKLKNTASAKE